MNMKCLWIAILSLLFALGAYAQEAAFRAAKPVWPKDRETEMNCTAGFRTIVDKLPGQSYVLRVAASTTYRVFAAGKFVGYGPARGPHGWYRIDEWHLESWMHPGKNVVAVEVAGYNVNSYALLDQPSFLQAELIAGSEVLAATGVDDKPFPARVLTERVQKVQRYSFQRPFSEVWRFGADSLAWRLSPEEAFTPEPCSIRPSVELLPRRVSYPRFEVRSPIQLVAEGTLAPKEPGGKKPRIILAKTNDTCRGYAGDDIEANPLADLAAVTMTATSKEAKSLEHDAAFALGANQFKTLDFGTNYTGFIGLSLTCREQAHLIVAFDEILSDGDVSYTRLNCVNTVGFDFAPGQYTVTTMEPYTLRYLKIAVIEGACEDVHTFLYDYTNPDTTEAHFACADGHLNHLFAAGVETFSQNAVDVFMDCPSRERAGWLCDSFFTARVAKDLAGVTRVEDTFLENFALPQQFPHLPPGMLPMCYPSDHDNGNFIPNWALWFVVQLEEYAARGGNPAIVESLKPKVAALFDYFKPFKNSDGLLEKLDKWVFVEWSRANDFVQDVNYPSNMLYAGALSAAGRLFDVPEWKSEADAVRETVRKQSFDGEFFVDNALRKDGKLEVTGNHTEVCQYFAFFFDVATPETHAKLWETLRSQFGPKRGETKAFPEVFPANSFIGNMLRIELLSRAGLCQQVLDESVDYLLYMADRTGTLWENVTPTASCDHGFASHIVHTLYRDVLGLYRIDTVHKNIQIRFADLTLPSCEGTVPTPDGAVTLRWHRDGKKLRYHIEMPAGYEAVATTSCPLEIASE